MMVGDRVRVIGVPADLPASDAAAGIPLRMLFEHCVGRVFPIVGITDIGWVEFEVGEVIGLDACKHSIWLESEFVEIVSATLPRDGAVSE
jgi:hypothetical protein